MKKFILGFICGLLLMGTTFAATELNVVPNPFTVFIDGVQAAVEGYNINGFTYLKLADFKQAGLTVKFNETDRQIEITQADSSTDSSENIQTPETTVPVVTPEKESQNDFYEIKTIELVDAKSEIYQENGKNIALLDLNNSTYISCAGISAIYGISVEIDKDTYTISYGIDKNNLEINRVEDDTFIYVHDLKSGMRSKFIKKNVIIEYLLKYNIEY